MRWRYSALFFTQGKGDLLTIVVCRWESQLPTESLLTAWCGHLARESRFWLGLSLPAPVGVSGCLVFSTSEIQGKKKKAQGTHHSVVPQGSKFIVGLPSSFHFSESSCVCFTYNVQGLGLYLVGGIGEVDLLHFPENRNLCKNFKA